MARIGLAGEMRLVVEDRAMGSPLQPALDRIDRVEADAGPLWFRAYLIGPIVWMASVLLCVGMNRREAVATKVFLSRVQHNVLGLLAILAGAIIIGFLLKLAADFKTGKQRLLNASDQEE